MIDLLHSVALVLLGAAVWHQGRTMRRLADILTAVGRALDTLAERRRKENGPH